MWKKWEITDYVRVGGDVLEHCFSKSGPWNLINLSSVAQSCPTLCDPMDCSTPGLSVHHQLPEFTQTHVCCDGDAIQPSHPSHPLSSPSPPHQPHLGTIDMQIVRLHLRSIKLKNAWGCGMWFKQPSRWFWAMLKFGNYCFRSVWWP